MRRTFWRSPPDRRAPRSPTEVCMPSLSRASVSTRLQRSTARWEGRGGGQWVGVREGRRTVDRGRIGGWIKLWIGVWIGLGRGPGHRLATSSRRCVFRARGRTCRSASEG